MDDKYPFRGVLNVVGMTSRDEDIQPDIMTVFVHQVAAGGTSSRARLRWQTAACRQRCGRHPQSCTDASCRSD